MAETEEFDMQKHLSQVASLDEELRTGTGQLALLLEDKGEFTTICEGIYDEHTPIKGPRVLAAALTKVAERAEMVEVDLDEAEDMYIDNLTRPEFCHLAYEYFSSLRSAMDLTNEQEFERMFGAMSAVLKSANKP